MPLILGTRNSKLALIQAGMVKNKLESLGHRVEIKTFVSEGDSNRDLPLYKMSSTGVFVEDLNRRIIENEIDLAVHSSKDIPSYMDERLEISAVLRRDDFHDIIISKKPINEMNEKHTIGTSSMRRIREVKTLNHDVNVLDIRGNIDTRLLKYKSGKYDAIIMAKAAYDRMNLDEEYYVLDETQFVPSPNQGIISIVTGKNSAAGDIVSKINDKETYEDMWTERYIVNELRLGCSMPVGILSHGNRVIARFYSLKNDEYSDLYFKDKNKSEMVKIIKNTIAGYGYGIN